MKDKKTIILFLIFLSLLSIFIYIILKDEKTNNSSINYNLVSDYNMFYTIESSVNKYLNYLSSGNTKSLLKVLNNDYVVEKNINEENILNKLDNYNDKNIFLRAKKVYNLDNNYYVYGVLYEETINKVINLNDYYIKINLYDDNTIFDITPISKNEYQEVINE